METVKRPVFAGDSEGRRERQDKELEHRAFLGQ